MPELPTGTITLLFADIEGSTQLLKQLDERYTDVLAECRSLLRTAFHAYGGHEVDTQGGAFFVAFTRASNAACAAVEMQRAIASHAWPDGVAVRVRMGLHTDESSVATEGYVGLDVHQAARIMSAGHGGQVLLSQTTRDLVEHELPDGVLLRDLGGHRLKDSASSTHLYQLVISDLPADFPPLKTLTTSPHNLPIQPTPFIGREKEVVTVQQQLLREDVRLLTLTGPGGVGKTRLGLHVVTALSEHFADGIWFVSLAPISDPDLVIPTITQMLGLSDTGEWSPLEQLKGYLREKQVLLLLDNFEQVVSASLQVADLLTVCPQLKVLVTSRIVLHVRAEHEFTVPMLALPNLKRLPDLVALSQYEAVALFIERAQAVKPDFQVTNANAPAVAEICARLDGLPLAIELAAARIKLLPPPALLARLGQHLQLLQSSSRDVPARQQTLWHTIKWSYDLLTAQEQQLFRWLSAFVGGCTLEAAEAVSAALGDALLPVLDKVTSLIDKNLLLQTAQEGEEPRLMILEMIRDFGLESLTEHQEMEMTRAAHAAYYLALAKEADSWLLGLQQAVWLDRLEREHDNLRAAMQWLLGQAGNERAMQGERSMETALRLGGALGRFWSVHGHISEGRTFLDRALAAREGIEVSVLAKALIYAADLAFIQSDYDHAEPLLQESLALYRDLEDQHGTAFALSLLGSVAWTKGHMATARTLTEEALAISRQVDDRERAANALFILGLVSSSLGEYNRARGLYEESVAIHRALGNKRGIAHALSQLAQVLLVSQGDRARVNSLLEECLAVSQEVGFKEGIAAYYCISGQVALIEGDLVTARSLAEKSVVLYTEMGHRHEIAKSLSVLGKVFALEGDYAAAQALFEQSLSITVKLGEKWVAIVYLLELGEVVAAQRQFAWAAQLWGASEALRDALGIPIPLVERTDYERSVLAAKVHLGERAFATAWVTGRSMMPEQALAALIPVTKPISGEPSSVPPAKSSNTYPAGLTAREVEVLRLVARGLTDAQVAEQLVISPRTVNTHLTSIYNKLGVDSRTAASRFALEQRLV
jgi:predicted ATPase/class 3 adenylate cyclase/DNA-binding CsgD family transcriptional regulator